VSIQLGQLLPTVSFVLSEQQQGHSYLIPSQWQCWACKAQQQQQQHMHKFNGEIAAFH